jgi:hypothetical protein
MARLTNVPLILATLLLVLGSPFSVHAATYAAEKTLVVSEAADGNSYVAAGTLTVAAPVAGDLSAIAGSLSMSAPVAGDALLAGGSVQVTKPVVGDLRVLGGSVTVSAPVGGDLFAVGGTVTETDGTAKTVFVTAGTARLLSGSAGPVTVYGSDIYLAGNFSGDVHAVASNRLVITPGTHISGTLSYEAPETATVPTSALVDGGVKYTGASFLPTSQEAQAISLAGAGVFLFVKILGSLIAVGLLAGLFPLFTETLASRILRGTFRRFALYGLLGFAVAVATPILIVLLALTFVGLGIALIIGASYVLALSLAYCYAGIVAGAAIREQVFKRRYFSWRFAVLGMFVLSVIYLVPVIGPLIFYILWAVSLGALMSYAYEHLFGHVDDSGDLFESIH